MSDSRASADTAGRLWRPLGPEQRRVLGVLIEKAKTTPAGYPMSVNAIVTGCNQKNNRDPVMTLDDFDVEKALDELRRMGAVSEIDWVGRVAKYKHLAYEWFGVDRQGLAVMAELLLRGDQTLGELRARAARMEPIEDVSALGPIVDGLIQSGLVAALTPAGRGQVVGHRLHLPEERRSHEPATSANVVMPTRPAAPAEVAAATRPEEHASISALREEIAQLRQRVAELERRLGG